MDRFEVERFAMQFRWRDGSVASLKLPGKHRGVIVVVAQRFAVRCLMFFAEMRAAGLVTGEGVDAEQLAELEKISNSPRALERLIEIFAGARHADPAVAGPELL